MGKWMKICFGYEFEGFRSKNEKGCCENVNLEEKLGF